MPSLVNDSGLFTMSEFRSRGIVKLAPDILVYVHGSLGTRVIAPVCGNSNDLNFNDGITTLNVQNTMTNPGQSNATIEVVTPIYGENSRYWTTFSLNGQNYRVPFFVPMMEVRIYARGRYLVDSEPKYYPIFWGFITQVEENYSGGVWKMTLTCSDMLYWWSYSQVNVHPSVETNQAFGYGNVQHTTVFQNIFEEANPFTIIWRLTNDIYTTKQDQLKQAALRFITPSNLKQDTNLSYSYPPELTRYVALGLMNYWKQRFGTLGGLLKMYGAAGELAQTEDSDGRILQWIRPNEISISDPSLSDKRRASYTRIDERFNVTSFLQKFTTFGQFENFQGLSQAEYRTKLEIATEVKNMVEYEFFQDVDGTLVFKPPFYNLDTSNVEPYVIRPYDIINSSFQTNSDAIVTSLEVLTPFQQEFRSTKYPLAVGFHVDINLAAKYGLRHKTMIIQYIPRTNEVLVANQLAVGHMALINAKATTGAITIPGRPEMKLGYPIYIHHRDSYHYVTSINHSFDYAGSFSTTLSLEAERRREFGFDGGKWTEPQKNKVYVFTGELSTEIQQELLKTANDIKAEKLLYSQQRASSIAQGRYKIEDINVAALDTGRTVIDLLTVTDKTVPYTDIKGYRLIGSFLYGRNIKVDGKTRMTAVEMNASANTLGNDIEQRTNNDKITMMHPSFADESVKMSTFFKEVANEDGIIPKPIGSESLSISVVNAKNEQGLNQIAEQITFASSGERKCKSDDFWDPERVRRTLEKAKDLEYFSGVDERMMPQIGSSKVKYLNNKLIEYEGYILENAEQFDLDPALIKAVISTESYGNNYAISGAGAKGLMQLIDSTAQELGVTDSFNPQQNIRGGSRYLRQMLDRYNGDVVLALAAYNAGPGTVDAAKGVPNIRETQKYVRRVLAYRQAYSQ